MDFDVHSASITSTFFITAGTFGAMSFYGYVTKRDLTSIGNLCFMALIGLIIASIVNIFWRNHILYWVVTYAGVLIFVGLTAYDTRKIKQMANNEFDAETGRKGAVMGALALYLDFINLFLFLLRIFGRQRRGESGSFVHCAIDVCFSRELGPQKRGSFARNPDVGRKAKNQVPGDSRRSEHWRLSSQFHRRPHQVVDLVVRRVSGDDDSFALVGRDDHDVDLIRRQMQITAKGSFFVEEDGDPGAFKAGGLSSGGGADQVVRGQGGVTVDNRQHLPIFARFPQSRRRVVEGGQEFFSFPGVARARILDEKQFAGEVAYLDLMVLKIDQRTLTKSFGRDGRFLRVRDHGRHQKRRGDECQRFETI